MPKTPPSSPSSTTPRLPSEEHAKGWTLFASMGGDAGGALLGDRFEVGELLGAGGTAWVYACRDRVLRCMAAIKILKDGTADARRRFREEARILANLRHPHLVQVLAVGETDTGAPFMVLELLPGQSLDERLRREGPLPWREVVELVAQAAGALEVLHAAGVVHRDMKPSNLVQIGSATSRPLVKLIDLGVAKVQSWERVQGGGFTLVKRHQTDAGLVVGTPGFYPPEASHEQPTPRFDTFALGVTIYVLCTGQMPNLLEHRAMGEVRPECAAPPELEALVTTALAVLPEDRVATAEEFQRRLEAIRLAHAEVSTPYLFDGCYELLELLGVGAKGEVYRAYHRDAARYVALKLLSARSIEDPEECVRFAREALALSATRHPALPELVDCRTSAKRKQPFIAMALVHGRHVGDFRVGKDDLGVADVVAIGKQLAGALAALHARGILHRDVHGANVLIELGRTPSATLIDVGMAEFTNAFYAAVDQRYPTPPEHRVKLGSGGLEHLAWTAPEARATKIWTAKCDVYSLGRLLYKLLTGKLPTRSGSRELVSPRKLVPACPVALSTALLAALHEDPAERVDMQGLLAKLDAAADELADELEEAADEVEEAADEAEELPPTAVPLPAGGEMPPSPATSPAPRRPWARAAMMATLAAVALGLGWWGGRVTATPTTPLSSSASIDEPQRANPAVGSPEPPMTPATTPELPTMRASLDAVAADLRRCAAIEGGLLVVEFTTGQGSFTKASTGGTVGEDVTRCVHDVIRSLRFQAGPLPTTFTEEYLP